MENLELREILSLKRIMNLGTNLETRYHPNIPINLSFLAFEPLNWFYKNATKVGKGKNHSFKAFKMHSQTFFKTFKKMHSHTFFKTFKKCILTLRVEI